nr:PepSY-associated TM helix domain-containing protein [uncultured Duganella sp.]
MQFFLTPRPGAGGMARPLADNQVFVHPYTGAILGSRNANDLRQGRKALMPFIYRLHYTLTFGAPGALAFGVVALVWTVDCFIGFYLTLPAGVRSTAGRPWLARWRPAWTIRRGTGFYKRNVDPHRAGGLWLWPMLFVIALSSVALALPTVYSPAVRKVLAHQADHKSFPRLARPDTVPAIDWRAARAIGRREMAAQAARLDFRVIAEDWMFYDAGSGVYRYAVASSRDIRDTYVQTTLYIDARSGEVRGVWLPTGAAAGDTMTTWLTSLHMASLGGTTYKAILSMVGAVVAMLSATGIYLWWKKRDAKRLGKARVKFPALDGD